MAANTATPADTLPMDTASGDLVLPPLATCTVAVIGLGYVGLPLAVEFAKPQACRRTGTPLQRRVIGFDVNGQRLEELRQRVDRTHETSAEELQAASCWSSRAIRPSWRKPMCSW